MNKTTLTCIECPIGCSITVTVENNKAVEVTGNACVRGKVYAEQEVIEPLRVVTTTVKLKNGKLLPVKTDKPVKKKEIFEVIKKINEVVVDGDIKIGDVIVENITKNVNLVATNNSVDV